MQIRLHRLETLPRLAWLAVVRKGHDDVDLFAGPWVEVRDGFFCEGAWDGDFELGDFEETYMAGSGGTTSPDRVTFVAPNDTLDRLHFIRRPDAVLVSNSLAFVLTAAEDALRPGDLFVPAKFHSIRFGLRGYVKSVPTRRGRVEVRYHCNLVIDGALHVTEIPKRPTPEFKDFHEYRAYMVRVVSSIFRNAADARRTVSYVPIASVSAGYDSTGSAVIARDAGCSEALTFLDPADSGKDISTILGYAVTETDKAAYTRMQGFPEAEFLACGVRFSDAVMLSWEQILPKRMLLTGFNGSHLWNRRTPDVSEHIVRDTLFTSGGSSGSGLAEFRMRVGYLHLAIPYVGITSAPSVYRISNSPELRPWSLGTTYDRPVARRLLEEAGVPREAFGQEKMGGWLPPPESSGQSDVSAGLRADFSVYYPKYWGIRAKVLSLFVNVLIYPYRKARALNHRIAQILGDRPLRWRLQAIASSGRAYWLTLPLGPHSVLPHWALEKMRDRYESGRARVQELLGRTR